MNKDHQVFEVKPAGYLGTAANSEDHRARVVVARQERRRADPQPDSSGPVVTGRYQDKDGSYILININQAGKHIECVASDVVDASTTGNRTAVRLTGEASGDGSYSLSAKGDQSLSGTLRPGGGGNELHLELTSTRAGSQNLQLVLNSPRATLLESSSRRLPAGGEAIKYHEWTPLTREQLNWLQTALSPARIEPLLREYLDIGGSTHIADCNNRALVAVRLDRIISEAFSTEAPDGWHRDDLILVRFLGRQMLTANKYTYGSVTRSHLAWFDLIVRRVAADWWSNPTLSQESSYRLHNICQHLGLAPDPKAGSVTHRYKMTITGSGLAGDVGIGLGGFIGAFRMQKTDSQTWQEDYTFWNAGISAGVSIGVEAMLDNDGEASSTSEWRPGDVPGWYTILDESSGFALGVGPSFGVGVMAVYGSGAHPPLAFITSPWSMAAGASGTLIDLGMSWGYIHEAGTNLNRQDASHIKHKNDYAVESEKTQEIHFRLGSAILTQEARQIVREMCAIELASFMSVGSVLVIIGHADRLDTENRNLELSKLRAENALQAIKDILGDQLKIPSNQISVHGAGELKAEYAGDADETPNPKWRKVEVILNSTLILTLRGD